MPVKMGVNGYSESRIWIPLGASPGQINRFRLNCFPVALLGMKSLATNPNAKGSIRRL
jgi:hypothetical protein